MRLKSELYEKEQNEMRDKISNILDLDNKNVYTLYELDNNLEIQTKINGLIPELRKWFAFNNMKAVGEPDKRKRPWLSIMKNILKPRYTMDKKEYQFKVNDKWRKSPMYVFTRV